MNEEERPETVSAVEHRAQEAGPSTGSYAHQDLVAMMRRRREAEEKLRLRQQAAAKPAHGNGQH
ncbi:hypothetical protein D477_018706 [Arthrobacter crystallopoietes BAB-32]|uniref:Uncharacterized protein n=1 Tax=Arthrobacter crystallopoietes BAB-32 TaxID=1246476 RepID=N1UXW8_9MICC|nr:hypothetical protein [Arthrobacter crystallopoietes]EMY32692.1 hypothetical protein D477_018706 [Arthrobacter crystallopoietes BAB-32]